MTYPVNIAISIVSQNAFPTISHRRRLLEAICEFPELVLTHWSSEDVADSRMKRYRNVDEMMAPFGRRGQCDLNIRRDQDPRWYGFLRVDSTGTNSAVFRIEREPHPSLRPLIFQWSDEVARACRAEFGIIHFPTNLKDNAFDFYNAPAFLKAYKYRLFGPPGFGTRTYLGPRMVEFIGETYLRATGAFLAENAWGGLTVDLVKNPWEAPLEQLIERHKQVMEVLAPSMAFGDYSQLVEDPGPRWAEYTARVKNLPPTDLPME